VQKSRKQATAPKGVPTIVNWKRRRDGGIAGNIYGSPNFKEGDRVETTKITNGNVENGFIVQTGSGSRYFLSDTAPSSSKAAGGAMQSLFGAIPGATITLTKEQKESDGKAALEAIKEAKPRATFSLFGLGGGGSAQQKETTDSPPTKKARSQKKKPQPKKRIPTEQIQRKVAPRGVPTISNWRKNVDGSVTGFISGSPNFNQGERVTTSPIKTGKVGSGEVVKTGSGSRYFLA